MIIIKFADYSPGIKDIEERIKSLSLAYKKEETPGLSQPTFEDGSIKVEGLTKINNQIDQLEGEMKQWWYCSC